MCQTSLGVERSSTFFSTTFQDDQMCYAQKTNKNGSLAMEKNSIRILQKRRKK
jgi:hypothetical protein